MRLQGRNEGIIIESEVQEIARKYALQNAVQFEGVAELKAVIGKVIRAYQKKDLSPKEIIPIVTIVVTEVNSLSFDEQQERLLEIAPELLEKKKQTRDFSLPDLPEAEMGKVVTRFPPEPNGYLHIGHAKAAVVDYQYAKRYDGRFILRFDDTNPEKDKKEFYEAQKNDLKWLGISWDEEYAASDHLETHYQLAEQLIRQGDAYMCDCVPEDIKKGRYHKQACQCRSRDPDEVLNRWNDLLSGELTDAVLRMKGDMHSLNTAMRDPTLFRIIDTPHPLQGNKYHVWPTYDFAGAVEDSIGGVTHSFRSKEYELRDECYFYLLEKLGLRKPVLLEFARLSIEGMPVSKRKITPLIQQGLVSGYDDIRLPTLQGLRRRGIVPEAIKQFVLSQGISKVESVASFSLVEAANRKIIDPQVKRLFFVKNPVKLMVEQAPNKTVRIANHPTNTVLGYREIETKHLFYISEDDAQQINSSDIFRLKDLYNVRLEKKNDSLVGIYAGEQVLPDSLKIQWTTEDFVPLTVYVPHILFKGDEFNRESLSEVHGYAEASVQELSDGDIVQFERFGFVRIQRINNEISACFTHR